MNEQMIIEEARKYMQKAENLNEAKPVMIPQHRIRLAETGIKYTGTVIGNRRDLIAFCQLLNKEECFEKFSIIAVDAQCRPIGVYSLTGSLSEVSAYPRVIATYALLSNAHAVFLSHNHPGGTCSPSREDITSTLQIKKVLSLFDIHLLDHLITTPGGDSYSMAQHGDI